jgi:hypothetical protein
MEAEQDAARSMQELKALLEYLVKHNQDHAAELVTSPPALRSSERWMRTNTWSRGLTF